MTHYETYAPCLLSYNISILALRFSLFLITHKALNN